MKKKKKTRRKIDVHFSSNNPNFETDPKLFRRLDREFHFNIDLYATQENKLCGLYYSEEDPAEGNLWCAKSKKGSRAGAYGNPPYGRGLLKKIEHAVKEAQSMRVVVLLLPARVDTKWFRLLAQHAVVNLLPGRQAFYLHGEPAQVWSKKQKKYIHCKAPFPSLIAVLGTSVKEPRIKLWNEGERFLPKELRT